MSETLSGNYDRYMTANLDYFYSSPHDAEKRAEFEARGIIPTNNLSLWLVDEPEAEWAPGVRNPLDYRTKPFGHIITDLRASHPDLWVQIQQTDAQLSKLTSQLWDLLKSGDKAGADAISVTHNELYWIHAQVKHDAYVIIAPQVEALGIDPIVLCK